MSKDITAKLKRLETICSWMTDANRSHFTVEELIKECGVSRRSILRDIALLKEVGIELDLYYGNYHRDTRLSFEKLGLTPQIAATLCIAYEAAKQAGKEFAPTCKYISGLLSPQTQYYEINPDLPSDPLVNKLQQAIREKYYIKIVSYPRDQVIYAKPYCLVRAKERVDLIFACTRPHFSVAGYQLDYIPIRFIKELSFEGKSPRLKNKHFISLGVPKRDIRCFLKDHIRLMLL